MEIKADLEVGVDVEVEVEVEIICRKLMKHNHIAVIFK